MTDEFDSLDEDSYLAEESGERPDWAERNLLAAIISSAVCEAFGSAKFEQRIVRNAKSWLFSRLQPRRRWSFAWVAINLDLDPVALQELLLQYEGNDDAKARIIRMLRP